MGFGLGFLTGMMNSVAAERKVEKDTRIKRYFYKRFDKYGIVVVSEWPEGLVIWVGGKIVYKSWEL